MFTVTKLARLCGLSRTALLYYESIGLMPPAQRSGGNYRCYGEADMQRLLQICAYRDAGLKLEDIRIIMDRQGGDAYGVLKRRLLELDAEIGIFARSSAGDSQVNGAQSSKEGKNDYQAEVGFHHEGMRVQFRADEPLARRVRTFRTGRASGVSGVPPHSS
jgi:DNA-binding transcriptional MerR regulator